MTTALHAAGGEVRTSFSRGGRPGTAVFARVDYAITLPDESGRTPRGLAYYDLTDGRIDVNDIGVMMPNLHEVLGALMGPPPTDQ